MPEPIPGQSYRYVGEIRSHRGRVGVASNVTRLGRVWGCTLSNIREWGAAHIATSIEVLSSELESVEAPAPVGALGDGEMMRAFTERSRALREDLDFSLLADAYEGPEDELVAEITRALESAGYRVAVVGQLKAKGSGTTTGYPDMSVRGPRWPCGLACLLEVKTATGTLSPEQETFHTEGWSYVVRSVEEALRVVQATSTRFPGERVRP